MRELFVLIELSAIEPQLCRVSVIGGNTQVDMALPAAIPVANFIPDVVQLIASRTPDLSNTRRAAARHCMPSTGRCPGWATNRSTRAGSLHEAEVFDGELLVLRAVDNDEAPALFDRCHRCGGRADRKFLPRLEYRRRGPDRTGGGDRGQHRHRAAADGPR